MITEVKIMNKNGREYKPRFIWDCRIIGELFFFHFKFCDVAMETYEILLVN